MQTKTSSGKFFDVVVYEVATRRVESVVGKSMPMNTGHSNAERRLESMLHRINDNYAVAIVKAGASKQGSILKDRDFAD